MQACVVGAFATIMLVLVRNCRTENQCYICTSKNFSQPYPFTVNDRNTRYGPIRSLTSGRGMAAASSMTTSSA